MTRPSSNQLFNNRPIHERLFQERKLRDLAVDKKMEAARAKEVDGLFKPAIAQFSVFLAMNRHNRSNNSLQTNISKYSKHFDGVKTKLFPQSTNVKLQSLKNKKDNTPVIAPASSPQIDELKHSIQASLPFISFPTDTVDHPKEGNRTNDAFLEKDDNVIRTEEEISYLEVEVGQIDDVAASSSKNKVDSELLSEVNNKTKILTKLLMIILILLEFLLYY